MGMITLYHWQENNEKQEDRLAKATLELAGACQRADGAVGGDGGDDGQQLDNGDHDDRDDDIYIMMKCLSVCVSRKIITSMDCQGSFMVFQGFWLVSMIF